MNFSIDSDIGPLGILLVCLLMVPVVLVIYTLIIATRRAQKDVADHDPEGDAPIA